jgi:hypothetical protein
MTLHWGNAAVFPGLLVLVILWRHPLKRIYLV